MTNTDTIVIGASISGLACAGCLSKKGIDHVILEKESNIAAPWRNHYDRLHLHTTKGLSHLPYMKFDGGIPKYPSRLEVIDYLEEYCLRFSISPIFDTEVKTVERQEQEWLIKTNQGDYVAKHVIMATGPFGRPRDIDFIGKESFPGTIIHSSSYKTGKGFKGKRVLVVGFGNSACEIAIDLYEQGAYPSLSARSAVNVLPRDVLGISVLKLGLISSKLPPKVADKLNAPLIRALIGDITKLGLKKLPYGPLVQINEHQTIPLLDIGTIDLIKKGHIHLESGLEKIEKETVHFDDGKASSYDAIVAAIGFKKGINTELLKVHQRRVEDLGNCIDKQHFFGEDGLYFCGFWISPTGQIREIARDARKIVNHIEAQLEA